MTERGHTKAPSLEHDLEAILERAFWRFDALHKPHYRDVSPGLPGAMSERDAFKSTVRWLVLDVLGRHVTVQS